MAKKSVEHKPRKASRSLETHVGKSAQRASTGSTSSKSTNSQGIDLPEGTTSKSGCLKMVVLLLLPALVTSVYLVLRS